MRTLLMRALASLALAAIPAGARMVPPSSGAPREVWSVAGHPIDAGSLADAGNQGPVPPGFFAEGK